MIGRYISMTEVLSPIAYDVLLGLSQLVEYYVCLPISLLPFFFFFFSG